MLSHRRVALLAQGILGVLAGSCATAPAKGRTVEVEQTMVELRAQNVGYVRRIEELQNRIFILEDQLSSRRKAEGRRPPPASKRLGATSSERATPTETQSAADDESNVEYAGDAALPKKGVHARPVLQLAASGRTTSVTVGLEPWSSPGLRAASVSPESLRLYRQSVDALHAGHNGAALTGFRKFLARYPHHDYADNAQYWVGQCYYDLNQFHAAAREFRRVVELYPHGNKVPEAMLKLGFSELASGERRDGRQMLESLRRTYPKHAAAQLAAARLRLSDEPPGRSTVTLEMSGR